jgi:hypothetical protein
MFPRRRSQSVPPSVSAAHFLQFAASSTYNALQFSARRSISPLTLSVAYTYSHAIDDSSTGGFGNNPSFIDSYNLKSGRASSDFDVRHILNISYVYDLPFFRGTGLTNKLLGGWQYSESLPRRAARSFSVISSVVFDNAGVSNGPDRVLMPTLLEVPRQIFCNGPRFSSLPLQPRCLCRPARTHLRNSEGTAR